MSGHFMGFLSKQVLYSTLMGMIRMPQSRAVGEEGFRRS